MKGKDEGGRGLRMKIDVWINEMKWVAMFSLSLMFLWSIPLVLRLLFAIPIIIFILAFVEEPGSNLFFKCFVYAGIISIGIIYWI